MVSKRRLVLSARVWAPVAPLMGVVGLGLWACVTPPLDNPAPHVVQTTPIRVAQNLKNKVDILFMVDNSNSMDAMSTELRNKFGQFFAVFDDLAKKGTYADLQIGVVTSDYGAGKTGAPGCTPSPGGQQGKLQAVGVAAAQTCKKPVGANFLKYAYTVDGKGANNLPPLMGNSVQDLLTTFTCMASVGTNGCGFEHQLESTYAALRLPLAENKDFVRDDALLVVVYLTNEDDASAPPDSDVFDKNLTAQYGYLDSYSRQTRFAIVCGNPPQFSPYADSGGALTNCVAAPNPDGTGPGKQFDISRYIDFFTKPAPQGGVKLNPLDVVLVAIDAPSEPFQVLLSDPGTPGGKEYKSCPQLNEASNPPCVPVLQHSCMNPSSPSFFGDPAVRINTVVNAVQNHQISSICDNDYSAALQGLANLIVSNLGQGCIPGKITTDKDGNIPADANGNLIADCVVEDVSANTDGSKTVREIKTCTCKSGAMGCAEPEYPCWRLEVKDKCTMQSPQSVGITIDRHMLPAPDNTTANVYCTTISG